VARHHLVERWDSRHPARIEAAEYGSWVIYGVGSRYQTTSEDTADWEDLVGAVVNCRVCELAIALQLVVVTICKCAVNSIINSNLVYHHSITWQNVNTITYILDISHPSVFVWNDVSETGLHSQIESILSRAQSIEVVHIFEMSFEIKRTRDGVQKPVIVVSQSAALNDRTSSIFNCRLLFIKIWSIWLCVLPSGDVQVNLWMLCGNIVLLTVRFLYVAKLTTLTPL
jgi:hypothetical protein